MQDHGFLLQALIYLAAVSVFVPVFTRLGLGSVLGYLVAGVAIGPWVLGLITDRQLVAEVSELGVVLLLFLVGLELNPQRLWSLRRAIFGLGSLQVLLTIGLLALALRGLGLDWAAALALGMAGAMSSTAIALQLFAERKLMATPPAQSAFAVALFQDLAVIPLLLGLALLAPDAGTAKQGFSWLALVKAGLLIAAMIGAGRLLLRPLLRRIAGLHMREVFIAFALLLIVGSAYLTQSIGLSLALGSFIAGILLADSEYRMELEVDIEPFKGLLLGLFFIAVGMSIDLGLIARAPLQIAALALAVVAIKFAVLAGLGRLFRLCREDGWLFSISLSQVGEFAFVLITQAGAEKVLSAEQAGTANAVVALSMLCTPLLFLLYEKMLAPRYAGATRRAPDVIEERNRVIVAGIGRFGQIVARLLLGRKFGVTVIDHDPNQVELTGRFGYRSYYGDASRPDVLQAAGIGQAELIVLAMSDPDAVRAAADYVRQHHPQVRILARARSRTDALELARAGVPVVRETFASALEVAQHALVALGDEPQAAVRAAAHFRAQDERQFKAQMTIGDNEEKLIALNNQGRRELMQLLENESEQPAAAYSPINLNGPPTTGGTTTPRPAVASDT